MDNNKLSILAFNLPENKFIIVEEATRPIAVPRKWYRDENGVRHPIPAPRKKKGGKIPIPAPRTKIAHIKPTHKTHQFKYLMQNKLEWTDLYGSSFNMVKIADLLQHDRNPHVYNHKLIYTTINKISDGDFDYKLGIQCFTLQKVKDYTLCIEFLNTYYKLWHKSVVSVDKNTAQGLTIGDSISRKFSHKYTTSSGQVEFMYYIRFIVNFKKTADSAPYSSHVKVDIQKGEMIWTHMQQNHILAYGLLGKYVHYHRSRII